MSAPDTDLEKQKKRHFGPLIGVGAVIVLAVILLVGYFAFMAQAPGEGEADIVASPDVEAVTPGDTVDTE